MNDFSPTRRVSVSVWPTFAALLLFLVVAPTALGTDEPIPDDELEEVESPLVSEIEVSPVVKTIMEGGWWHDRSAAHLTVEDAILRKVGFSKKRKGRKNTIFLVKVHVGSRVAIQSVDRTQVELFDADGTKLASKTWKDETAGRGGNLSLASTRVLKFEHLMSTEEFEALWADDQRPMVRVTVEEVD